jgi:L-ascorbate 6-phosphate lactonase
VDHLDPPTVREWGRAGRAALIAPPTTVGIARDQLGWRGPCVELTVGESTTLAGVRATATWARHGYLDPAPEGAEAVGFLVRAGGVAVWHAGDTEYDARLHRAPPGQIDVALLPINGTGGNMNAHEAALLASQLRVKLAVPMHFGLWPDEDYTYDGEEPWATTRPEQFVGTYARLAPDARVKVPVLGEVIGVGAGGDLTQPVALV